MEALFQQRRVRFLKRCSKYLKYVLNDHFVLFLMFLVGLIAVQYSQLLRDFPAQHGWVDLGLLILVLCLPASGRIATYIEAPDQVFLLAKEDDLRSHLHRAMHRSFVFWALIQTLILCFVFPLFLAVGFSLWQFGVLLLLSLLFKYRIYQGRLKAYLNQGGMAWSVLVEDEVARQQRILQFFALFTHVKGISTGVKRRSYLDGLLSYIPKNHTHTWKNLYARAWLRTGDYFALTLRLSLLALGMPVFVRVDWVAVILMSLFNYLLLFQLVGLYKAYDNQLMTRLLPVDPDLKRQNLLRLISQIMLGLVLLETLWTWWWVTDKAVLLLPLGLGLVLNQFYLPAKLRKLQAQDGL